MNVKHPSHAHYHHILYMGGGPEDGRKQNQRKRMVLLKMLIFLVFYCFGCFVMFVDLLICLVMPWATT